MEQREMVEIIISWVTISLAFSMTALQAQSIFPAFATSFPIILLTLGVGFIFHELGHRWLAKKYGCIAFYKMWVPGLALALGMAIMTGGRLIFAAPGAVLIGGKRLSLRQEGMVALIGPVTNMLAGTLFLLIALRAQPYTLLSTVGSVGAYVNFFLAFFNMIPFPPLDGQKVLQWNPMVWIMALAIAGYMSFVVLG